MTTELLVIDVLRLWGSRGCAIISGNLKIPVAPERGEMK